MIETALAIVQEVAKEGVASGSGWIPEFAKDIEPTQVKDYVKADKPLQQLIEEYNKPDVKEMGEMYTDTLRDLSPFPDTIENQDISHWEKVSPEEVAEKRGEFRNIKDSLIEQWEQQNGKEWPRYEEDVYSENGKLIRKAGDCYDAHHLRPLECGGDNTVDNITPLHAKDHFDRQGIHSPDGIYQQIVDSRK